LLGRLDTALCGIVPTGAAASVAAMVMSSGSCTAPAAGATLEEAAEERVELGDPILRDIDCDLFCGGGWC
jgi:hypothetical protein